MSKTTNFLVTIIGSDDKVIMEKKVSQLPLKEELIISQSIEFFNDPEPCMIHRTAVMKKIYMEFFSYFEELFSRGKPVETKLPESLTKKLDINYEIKYVKVIRC